MLGRDNLMKSKHNDVKRLSKNKKKKIELRMPRGFGVKEVGLGGRVRESHTRVRDAPHDLLGENLQNI